MKEWRKNPAEVNKQMKNTELGTKKWNLARSYGTLEEFISLSSTSLLFYAKERMHSLRLAVSVVTLSLLGHY